MQNQREVIITSDSSGESWSAAVWDPSTGSMLNTYKNAAAVGYHTLEIVRDTYVIAADVTKSLLYVWPLNGQSPVQNLRLTTPGKISALACTPNGSYLVAAVGEKIFLWQLTTGRLLGTAVRHYQTITCLKFSQDGSSFASGGDDGLVFIWSLAKIANNIDGATPTHGFSDHSLEIKDMHYGKYGAQSRLVTVSKDCTARIYDTNAGILLLTVIFDVPLTSVCMDIREEKLFVGSLRGSVIQVELGNAPRGVDYNVSTLDKSNNFVFRGHTARVTTLSVSTDCRTLLSGSADGAVHLWNIANREIEKTLMHKGPITTARFTPAYENYRASTLKPKLYIHPLQRISDTSDRDNIIEIISTRDDSHLLDFESYVGTEVYFDRSDNEVRETLANSLADAIAENEILKAKNSDLYKYAVKVLLSNEASKKSR